MPGAPSIERAVQVLRAGGLVAFPTETVYGLGADAENPRAVERIFAVKGRPLSHPLILHIGNARELEDWAIQVPELAHRLAESFWPGPLTLVLRRSPRVPKVVTGGLETVALRVPEHEVAQALLSSFGGGIAAPSANRFGAVSPTTPEHVREGLGEDVDYILDGGPCRVGVESTIVDVSGDAPMILRPGGTTREELERVLGRSLPVHSGGPVRVPGQHPLHYAPVAKMVLVAADQLLPEARRWQQEGYRVGLLLPPGTSSAVPSGTVHAVVTIPDTLTEYAHRLYGLLWELDHRGCEVIVVSLPPPDGLGLAIADRLRRAAGPRTP
jgi:L-threonylcarbamoyladenylate synthase